MANKTDSEITSMIPTHTPTGNMERGMTGNEWSLIAALLSERAAKADLSSPEGLQAYSQLIALSNKAAYRSTLAYDGIAIP